jgi:AcrR family transcriptional regulator
MDHKLHKPHLSTAQDARAVRTREALRRALLRLLGTKPLDQITIRDISTSARVGYTTFFRHHPTKDSLLNDVAAEQIKRLIDLVLPVLDAGDTRAVSVALCTYVDQHRALWFTLLTGGAAGALREEFTRMSRQIAATRSQPDHWLPNEVAVILVISATIELLAWWLRQKDPLTIEQIAKIHDRIVVSPTLNSDESGAWRRGRPSLKLPASKRSARGRNNDP